MAGKIIVPETPTKGNTDVLTGYAGLAIALRKVRDTNNAHRISRALMSILIREKPSLTGYAHGASGYALAIGILSHILDDSSATERIIQLLNWENTYYDSKAMNWRDLRGKNSKVQLFMNGWCSGTPGIIMSRKELLNITNSERVKEICINDIRIAEEWLKVCPLEDHDNLCCGNAAKIMLASRLGISCSALYEKSIRAVEQDNLNLQHLIGTDDFIPGLMQGYAGIGYALTMYGDSRCGEMLV